MILTNDQLDAAISIEANTADLAGLDTTPALDALFAERSERIAVANARRDSAERKFARDIRKAAQKLTTANMRRWLVAADCNPKMATWAEMNVAIYGILCSRAPAGDLTQDQEIRLNERAENWTDRF